MSEYKHGKVVRLVAYVDLIDTDAYDEEYLKTDMYAELSGNDEYDLIDLTVEDY